MSNKAGEAHTVGNQREALSNQESHNVENQDLMAIQIGLEEGMSARGVNRFWKNLNLASESVRED
jgi:hypothetical protein